MHKLILLSFLITTPYLKEAMYYERLDNNRVQCELCFRRCIIPEGKRGFCRVRENRKGKLYSLVYSQPATIQIDPIELEPMYHLVPGHKNLCVATASCNFRCKHCHNWHITQRGPEEMMNLHIPPEKIVKKAIKEGCQSISHSINEPTIFYEYMYEIVKNAKAKGLKTLFHTNGSLNPEPLKKLLKYMDGVTVDLKGFTDEFYKNISQAELKPVLRTLKIIKEEGVHLEVVYLIIPTLNDDLKDIRRACIWIRDSLGKDTPVHFTRFFPNYKLKRLPPTPIQILEKAHKIAKDIGLEYVYIGNVPGHKANSTYCPKCGKILIHRIGFKIIENKLRKGRCPSCGKKILGIWE